MLDKFRSYQLALKLYSQCKEIKLPYSLKDQLTRASSSVVLNLAEGSAKPTVRDRQRFYAIALASLREVQALIEMEQLDALFADADALAASLYKLCRVRTGKQAGRQAGRL